MSGDELREALQGDETIVLADIARHLGMTPQAFNSKLNARKVSVELIENISKAINKNVYELFDKKKPEEKEIKPKGVPVYDLDFTAGNVTKFEENQEKIIGHVDLNGFRKCIAFVKVKGNSMFPTFTGGDIVGLEPMEDISIIEYGQPFGVVTKSGQNMIKFIRKGKDEDNVILRSSSKDHDDIPIHKDQILKLYKAHGPIRNTFY